MFYKEYLDLVKDKDITTYKLVAAVEMNYFLEGENYNYTDEDFELMCEFVYEYFVDQDDNVSTPSAIAYELKEILFEDELFDIKNIKTQWWYIQEEMRKRLGE